MAAMLYKDLMVVLKTSIYIIFAAVLFAVLAGVSSGSYFFLVYPVIVLGALGFSCLSYDERCGWLSYAVALPGGRNRIVTEKYLLALLGMGAAILLTLISIGICDLVRGTFLAERMLWAVWVGLLIGTVQICLLLPVSFGMGTEKGRIIYLVCIGAACGASFLIPGNGLELPAAPPWISFLIPLACAVAWGISWWISKTLFSKREL